jgi:hypothetical protein
MANYLLFNFSVSYSGGGYKRLYEYSKVIHSQGGAHFIIHPNCQSLVTLFPRNHYHIVKQSFLERIFEDCKYLKPIIESLGVPDLYYSYGIPIYYEIGVVNWFHLSNVLPLAPKGISSSLLSRLKAIELGRRIRKNLANASVISAESKFSLSALGSKHTQRHFLSVNGADDELKLLAKNEIYEKSNIAVVVGTYKYKALADSYQIFNELQKTTNSDLKLVIIGPKKDISAKLKGDVNVIVRGLLSREEVIECLQTARFYISTTQIENSYNAASEGIFFASESYISNIGPHQELLAQLPYSLVSIPNVEPLLIKVKRSEINGGSLLTWAQVVEQMLVKIEISLANENITDKGKT